MPSRAYVETFDKDAGGWLGWLAGGGGPKKLEIRDSCAIARPPWGVDFNHAPPGAGYLQLLYALLTGSKETYRHQRFDPYSGTNRFVMDDYSRNFLDAKFTVRVRSELDQRGTDFLLLIQSDVGPVRTNYVLTGQPIRLGNQWSTQTLNLTPDPSQWTCLGVRRSGADCPNYGVAPIADALRDVNVDIILVLFPLDIVPAGPISGDPHELRAGKDYPVDESRLPTGYVMLDEVRIDFA